MSNNKFKFLFFVLLLVPVIAQEYQVENAYPQLPTMDRPVGLYHPDDDSNKLFVLEQKGVIQMFENTGDVNNLDVFLDIQDRVDDSANEMGLLGLAFHPNFSENGLFFVNYTTTWPRRTVISKFSLDADNPEIGDPDSELILLEVDQPYNNHNGGQIGFGPDGYLYIILGDGGSAGDPQENGQDLSTLLSSMLRINVNDTDDELNYAIPDDNPFINTPGARDEIFAYGLRNMWRFSWDSVTNLLYGADVGQNAWEEIDIIESGNNYGWNTMEGFHCYDPPVGCDETGLELPIWEYALYVNDDCSVTGGFVYRGSNFFSLTGKYIYGDYCTGRIWALEYDGVNPTVNEELLTTWLNISSFGLDRNNEIYFCSLGNGRIYRLVSDEPGGKGDVNQDEMTNILDIILVINIILGEDYSDYEEWAADMNSDFDINILDIVNIVNVILGN